MLDVDGDSFTVRAVFAVDEKPGRCRVPLQIEDGEQGRMYAKEIKMD